MSIQRPRADEYAAHYERYVACVPEGDLLHLLATQERDVQSLAASLDDDRASTPYAPGKWTGKDVLLHLADTERVMAYRALRIARGDATPLAAFEQDAFVSEAGASRRSVRDLLAELAAVRAATIALLSGLDSTALARVGTASGHPVSARALAFIISGHEREHLRILREQPGYLDASPLASA